MSECFMYFTQHWSSTGADRMKLKNAHVKWITKVKDQIGAAFTAWIFEGEHVGLEFEIRDDENKVQFDEN